MADHTCAECGRDIIYVPKGQYGLANYAYEWMAMPARNRSCPISGNGHTPAIPALDNREAVEKWLDA